MAANETRFTPFGITDILKTQAQETCPNTHGKLAEELCTKAQRKNGLKDANNQGTQLDCITKREMKTLESPSQTQGKV
jgi:hypothetical protein